MREGQVNATFGEVLAGCVVLELVLRQLEADQMLEGRVGDCGAHARIGKRVNGGVGLAGLARPGEDLADIRRKRRR